VKGKYIINCEYLNNLKGDGDMVGTSIMTSMRRGRVCTSRTQLKKSVIFHTHMHIQSMRRFS